MKILLTGAAGFIGFHLANALVKRGDELLGVDSLNSYYAPKLKHDRLAAFEAAKNFTFVQADVADLTNLRVMLGGFQPDVIVHLAAQAGVRYSLENPLAYIDANVRGHTAILELARTLPNRPKVIYASSSSVYGDRAETPFRETDRCDNPVSVYAASKRAGELIASTYAHLYGLSLTGLRFFTVYGPWGRPDMAYWSFTDAMLRDKPIRLFNEGRMRRDFTDIRDIVAGISAIIDGPAGKGAQVYNIGHAEPVQLVRFVAALESAIGKKAIIELAPMQPGDVGDTFADVSKLERDFGVKPHIAIEDGLVDFVRWYRGYTGL